MIAKAIEGLIKRTSLKTLRLYWWEYEWIDAGVLMINDETTMI